MSSSVFDVTFDMQTDAGGKDPDTHSPTLHRYHKLLWSKPLPDGASFDLQSSRDGKYLIHHGQGDELWLASDAVIPTFTRYIAMKPLIAQLDEQVIAEFFALAYTIGGFVLWPAGRVDGKMTINGARGFNRKISDRFDLTLECIRRHYLGEPSPFAEPLARYGDFFALFGDFAGYVDFWLLQDLLDSEGAVRFFTPFNDFHSPAVPKTVDEYEHYRRNTMDFIHARNRRMERWVASVGPE